jgi:hypothetical protein
LGARSPPHTLGVTPSPRTRAIGLAWHIDRASDLVWINGQTGGSHGFVSFDPRSGSGVEVLNNSATSVDDTASTRLLKRYLARSLSRLLQHQEPLMA